MLVLATAAEVTVLVADAEAERLADKLVGWDWVVVTPAVPLTVIVADAEVAVLDARYSPRKPVFRTAKPSSATKRIVDRKEQSRAKRAFCDKYLC